MKFSLLLILALMPMLCQAQHEEKAVRVYLAASLGAGISGNAGEMASGAFVPNFSVPIEFRHQWSIIPEIYGGGFRAG